MEEFIREFSFEGISVTSAIALARDTCKKNNFSFLYDMARCLENPNCSGIDKIYYMNRIQIYSIIKVSNNFHKEFTDYAMTSDISLKSSNKINVLTPLSSIARQYIANASDSIILRYIEDPDNYLSSLSIRVIFNEGKLKFDVTDNGTGIEKEVEPLLFSHLFKSTKKLHPIGLEGVLMGGAGISLSNIRYTAAQIDATVGYENKGIGKGATFWYELSLT